MTKLESLQDELRRREASQGTFHDIRKMIRLREQIAKLEGVVLCSRCGKPHVPLNPGRTKCIACFRQQVADANLQNMASSQPEFI